MPTEKPSDVIDINRLKSSKCFQQLPQVITPTQFKLSDEELESYDIETLVEKKLYLEAAKRAQKQLVEHEDGDYSLIFDLWYIRLSCLVLAKLSSIARDEAMSLGDFGSAAYRDDNNTCIVPWKLRILMVPLQSRGNNQIGLNRYFALRKEALFEAQRAETDEAKQEWVERLLVLGLHVASMLVGMKDYTTAIDHLQSMYSSTAGKSGIFKKYHEILGPVIALVYLQIGDTLSARQWFATESSSNILRASFYASLCSTADKDLTDAENTLSSIDSATENTDLQTSIENNLALVKLQKGDVDSALEHLEKLVENGCIDHCVLFNLFTIYDLQKINPDEKKSSILERIRSSGIESLGSYEFLHL